jgi:hypothetical protein
MVEIVVASLAVISIISDRDNKRADASSWAPLSSRKRRRSSGERMGQTAPGLTPGRKEAGMTITDRSAQQACGERRVTGGAIGRPGGAA